MPSHRSTSTRWTTSMRRNGYIKVDDERRREIHRPGAKSPGGREPRAALAAHAGAVARQFRSAAPEDGSVLRPLDDDGDRQGRVTDRRPAAFKGLSGGRAARKARLAGRSDLPGSGA